MLSPIWICYLPSLCSEVAHYIEEPSLSGLQYSCAVVSVFWFWREIVLKMRTPFDFLWAVSTKKSNWVTLLWSASQCVYFVRPTTLLLCVSLFCIFLLYLTDPQTHSHCIKMWRYVSHKIRTLYYWVSLSCIVLIYILTVTIVSYKYWELSVQVESSE